MSTRTTASSHHVVVIGAGFGGLETVHRLAGAPVRITLIDRRNHHLFQPLLYQVATASLAPSEIAWPIRQLLRRRRDVTTLLASVEAIDKDARWVRLDDGSTVDFDTLVLATGARHAYFGHDDWEPFAPGLKTLEDATAIRGRILLAFERAEREADEHKLAAPHDLRHRRRRPDRRRTRRNDRRTRAVHFAAGLPQHRHKKGADRADRGGTARVFPPSGRICPHTRSVRSNGSASRSSSARRSPNARAKASSMAARPWPRRRSFGRPACRRRRRRNGSTRRPIASGG